MSVGVVTDSTCTLPADVVAQHDVVVVPVSIAIGDEVHSEFEVSPAKLLDILATKTRVSTSRPAPALFAEAYRSLAESGCTEIVSIHLSGQMSGTVESAQLAARTSPVPVTVVDTLAVGPCLGFAVLAATEAVATGGDAAAAKQAAMQRAEASKSIFYVDTLEHLRRGGRVGAVGALVGSALAVKPLLEIVEGRVVQREKVRTSSRALTRMAQIAVEAAGSMTVEVCVAHLANQAGADQMIGWLTDSLGDQVGPTGVECWELGAVLGAHVGPGTIAVCVAPALTSSATTGCG